MITSKLAAKAGMQFNPFNESVILPQCVETKERKVKIK